MPNGNGKGSCPGNSLKDLHRWGAVDQHLDPSFCGQPRLAALLREATGIDDVKPETRPQIGAAVKVMPDEAIGTKATQRISLQARDGNLALCTSPAELKDQARAMYRTGRAQRLLDCVAHHPEPRQAKPNVHLAFLFARIDQQLYMDCHLGLTDYIRRWQGDDFAQIREHLRDRLRKTCGPWLRERQYASPKTTRSSTNSFGTSAAAPPICVPASNYNASGRRHTQRRSGRHAGQRDTRRGH